jgi:hypothetical protein
LIALPAGFFLDRILAGRIKWLVVIVISLIFLISINPIVEQYEKIALRALGGQPLDNSEAFEIAAFLKQNGVSGQPIYMMSDHIVYWLVDSQPLTKSTTHPSTIGKEYLLKILLGPDESSKAEMARVLGKKPEFIVKREDVEYLQDDEVKQLLHKTLLTEYKLVQEIGGRQIYRRLQTPVD